MFHYHTNKRTHASVGNPWNLRDPVRLSRQTTLRTVSENDVWRTGRQWKKAICVSAKCRALMGCCVAWAREIPISCSKGTLKLERRWKQYVAGVLILNTLKLYKQQDETETACDAAILTVNPI